MPQSRSIEEDLSKWCVTAKDVLMATALPVTPGIILKTITYAAGKEHRLCSNSITTWRRTSSTGR